MEWLERIFWYHNQVKVLVLVLNDFFWSKEVSEADKKSKIVVEISKEKKKCQKKWSRKFQKIITKPKRLQDYCRKLLRLVNQRILLRRSFWFYLITTTKKKERKLVKTIRICPICPKFESISSNCVVCERTFITTEISCWIWKFSFVRYVCKSKSKNFEEFNVKNHFAAQVIWLRLYSCN